MVSPLELFPEKTYFPCSSAPVTSRKVRFILLRLQSVPVAVAVLSIDSFSDVNADKTVKSSTILKHSGGCQVLISSLFFLGQKLLLSLSDLPHIRSVGSHHTSQFTCSCPNFTSKTSHHILTRSIHYNLTLEIISTKGKCFKSP